MKLVGTPSKDLIDKLSSEEVSPSPQLDNHDWYYHTDSCQTVCLCTQTSPNAPSSCAILPCILSLVLCLCASQVLAFVVSACVVLFPWDLSCGLQQLQWNVSFLVCPMYVYTQFGVYSAKDNHKRNNFSSIYLHSCIRKFLYWSVLWWCFYYSSVYPILLAIMTSGNYI